MNLKPDEPQSRSATPDQAIRHAVLVVGMHRSGTSGLSRLLNHLGFFFGDNLIKDIDGINSDGFWEDKTLVAINERIFELLGSSWYSFHSLPEKWWEKAEMAECYTAAAKWFDEAIQSRIPRPTFSWDLDSLKPIALKDPRFCRLLPFWLHFFKEKNIQPKIVFIYRHPYSVASSLKKRDGFVTEVSYLLWLTYTLDALELIPANYISILSYEDLLNNPVKNTKTLLDGPFVDMPALKRFRYTRLANMSIVSAKNRNPVEEDMPKFSAGTFSDLACELYKEMASLTPENAAPIAKIYRDRFESLKTQSVGLLSALQEEVNSHVEINRKLTSLGREHSNALKILSNKDAIYERSLASAENRIAGCKAYIAKCEARIKDQDTLLKKLGKKAELHEHLQKVVADRELKISENIAYIKKCEDRIKEQDRIMLLLRGSNFLWLHLTSARKRLAHKFKKNAP